MGRSQTPRLVRGMRDILPDVNRSFTRIYEMASAAAWRYRYGKISPAIVEQTELFHRAIGDDTDVVSKEMYTFPDGNQGLTVSLRPEGTAGVLRSAIANNLIASRPQRLFYFGPMFRRERPQKGRYRQFDQFGVECLGATHPHTDVEVIALGFDILKDLGLHQDVELRINSLCDDDTRLRHREKLYTYLIERSDLLSQSCKENLLSKDGNLLRILDSKDKQDQEVLVDAPTLLSVASADSQRRFESVLNGLSALHIPCIVDHKLVRGLDYYTSTVWEFTTDKLGTQAAVLAGGRYDRLARTLGAKYDVPAVGWAAGVDRLALLLEELDLIEAKKPPSVWIIAVTNKDQTERERNDVELQCLKLGHSLRLQGNEVEHLCDNSFTSNMRTAAKSGAQWVMLVGNEEVQRQCTTVKQMTTGAQCQLPLDSNWTTQQWQQLFFNRTQSA